MNLIETNSIRILPGIIQKQNVFFSEVFNLIEGDKKFKVKPLLKYLQFILDKAFLDQKDNSKVLHLHFEEKLDEESMFVIAQFILIRYFKINSSRKTLATDENSDLERLKTKLRVRSSRLKICPDGASLGKGGNRLYKNWIQEKKDIKSLVEFYNQFNYTTELSPNVLFNCQVGHADKLEEIFRYKPYAIPIGKITECLSYNLLNTKNTINNIDEIENSIIDNLESIVLFDCERKTVMQYFAYQDIENYGIDLNDYLILTFGNKQNSINSLKKKLGLIQSRFKISSDKSYTISRTEINHCLDRRNPKKIKVVYLGNEESTIWDQFLLLSNIHDLYELRSIKMLNIYSLCLNNTIKEYLLNDIFSTENDSEIITYETKQEILHLDKAYLDELKESLSFLLDNILQIDHQRILERKISKKVGVVVDNQILSSKKLRGLICDSLSIKEEQIIPWSKISDNNCSSTIVISYQDQGKYPYQFYPNIVESNLPKERRVKAFLIKFLFKDKFDWAYYNYLNDLFKENTHFIREKYFRWKEIKSQVQLLRPNLEVNINWDLEQEYFIASNRETIKVKLKKEKEKTYYTSELFIVHTKDSTYKIEKIEDIYDNFEIEDCRIQNLEEILDTINIYDRMIDIDQQEEELSVIRKDFHMVDEDAGRLWKILLKNRINEYSEEEVYESLKSSFHQKGLKIVSFNHFKHDWINPESESIAPINKNVFLELCSYLGLPKLYFILIQRMRNKSKQNTRQTTQKMNRLLKELFDDGCFDNNSDVRSIIHDRFSHYKYNHSLEDLGIDEKYLENNLITLVDLIKPELRLLEVENIHKTI